MDAPLAADELSPVKLFELLDRPTSEIGRFSAKSNKECVLFDAMFDIDIDQTNLIILLHIDIEGRG